MCLQGTGSDLEGKEYKLDGNKENMNGGLNKEMIDERRYSMPGSGVQVLVMLYGNSLKTLDDEMLDREYLIAFDSK